MAWTHLPICSPACSFAISSIRFSLTLWCCLNAAVTKRHWHKLVFHMWRSFLSLLDTLQFWSGSHFSSFLNLLLLTKWTLRHKCGCSASVMIWRKSLAGFDWVFWDRAEVQRKLWTHIVCVSCISALGCPIWFSATRGCCFCSELE